MISKTYNVLECWQSLSIDVKIHCHDYAFMQFSCLTNWCMKMWHPDTKFHVLYLHGDTTLPLPPMSVSLRDTGIQTEFHTKKYQQTRIKICFHYSKSIVYFLRTFHFHILGRIVWGCLAGCHWLAFCSPCQGPYGREGSSTLRLWMTWRCRTEIK